jgi:hypothetical protein
MEKMNIKLANECIKRYESTMIRLGIDSPEKGFTKSVGFNKKELLDWMQKLGKDVHEIKIYFGMYPASSSVATKNAQSSESADRFTAILWPYNSEEEPAKNEEGDEELPVNYGELMP